MVRTQSQTLFTCAGVMFVQYTVYNAQVNQVFELDCTVYGTDKWKHVNIPIDTMKHPDAHCLLLNNRETVA